MFKKRHLGFVAVFLFGMIAVVAIGMRTNEPVVEGRPLSDWLVIASDGTSKNRAARTNAEQVIRALGPTAIPFLLEQFETLPGWREKLAPAWNRFARSQGWWNHLLNRYRAEEDREHAITGFEILGTNAANAVPRLRELARDTRYAQDVARSLGYIQTEESLDVLILLLKHPDPDVRSHALYSIGNGDDRKHVLRAAPAVVPLINDSNQRTARAAVNLVSAIMPANEGIALLTNKFVDPRLEVARGAVGAFLYWGPWGEPAMPALATMLTNADEKTRSIATNALLTINPYRAPEFGVNTNRIEQRAYQIYHRLRAEFETNYSPYLP